MFNHEVHDPESLVAVPDASGAQICEDVGEKWSRYPKKPESISWHNVIKTDKRDVLLVQICRYVSDAWAGLPRDRWFSYFREGTRFRSSWYLTNVSRSLAQKRDT